MVRFQFQAPRRFTGPVKIVLVVSRTIGHEKIVLNYHTSSTGLCDSTYILVYFSEDTEKKFTTFHDLQVPL